MSTYRIDQGIDSLAPSDLVMVRDFEQRTFMAVLSAYDEETELWIAKPTDGAEVTFWLDPREIVAKVEDE